MECSIWSLGCQKPVRYKASLVKEQSLLYRVLTLKQKHHTQLPSWQDSVSSFFWGFPSFLFSMEMEEELSGFRIADTRAVSSLTDGPQKRLWSRHCCFPLQIPSDTRPGQKLRDHDGHLQSSINTGDSFEKKILINSFVKLVRPQQAILCVLSYHNNQATACYQVFTNYFLFLLYQL